ncbi:MAG TPA: lipoyl synthase [Polyangiaceae bacterium]|nr:lipoyl synthase [Polyangiaceae bacterium]
MAERSVSEHGPSEEGDLCERGDAAASGTRAKSLSGPASAAKAPAFKEPKPGWLKVRAPGGDNYTRLKETLRGLDLYTVCEEARCPNVGECWASGTATVMLLGHTCTRGCRFCAVTTGNPRGAYDPREPVHVARAIEKLGLRYVVLTMVDRDDLLDGGASQVAETVRELKQRVPELLVETLVGDFGGRRADIDVVLGSRPDVFAHNIEVPRRLTPRIRDQRCSYDRSIDVLRHAKQAAPERLVKSSIMVGIGETDDEIYEAMSDLRSAGVDIVTLGQYLRPTPKHAPVERYVEPAQFDAYAGQGRALGFAYVASGPLVRSSYHAAEGFVAAYLGKPLAAAAGTASNVGRAHAEAERLTQAAAAVGSELAAPPSLLERAARSAPSAEQIIDVRSLVRR